MTAKIGFMQAEQAPSETWLTLSTSGNLTFKAGGIDTTDEQITTVNDFYLQSDVEWIHLAVSCDRRSARCYFFRNASYVAESVENPENDWFVSNAIFIGKL